MGIFWAYLLFIVAVCTFDAASGVHDVTAPAEVGNEPAASADQLKAQAAQAALAAAARYPRGRKAFLARRSGQSNARKGASTVPQVPEQLPSEPLPGSDRLTALQVWRWREAARELLHHSLGSYMSHAYPADELRPLSCKPRWHHERERGDLDDPLLGAGLTLIDALDTLAVTGDLPAFRCAVSRLVHEAGFDRDVNVSVFELNIRVVGGLLSAHMMSVDPRLSIWEGQEACPGGDCSGSCTTPGLPHVQYCPGPAASLCLPRYEGQLLAMAVEVANRLMPAFDTPTGLPYHRINLATGLPDPASRLSCTAAAGTFLLEFGVLSRLTGDPMYEGVARRAVGALWSRRSPLGLLGNSIDVIDGGWRTSHTGIGAGIDSYLEYLLKAGLALDDPELLGMWEEARQAIAAHVDTPTARIHLEVGMGEGRAGPRPPLVASPLQAWYPGAEVLAGRVDDARAHWRSLASLWAIHRALPEGLDLATGSPMHWGRDSPLRPELAESTFLLYSATRDPSLVVHAAAQLQALTNASRMRCGYASVADVTTGRLDDRMDSFFISETGRYLFNIFDTALQHWFVGPPGQPSWKRPSPGPVVPANASASGTASDLSALDGRVMTTGPEGHIDGPGGGASPSLPAPPAPAGLLPAPVVDGPVSMSQAWPFVLPAKRTGADKGKPRALVARPHDVRTKDEALASEQPAPHQLRRLQALFPSAHPLAYVRYDHSGEGMGDAVASLSLEADRVLHTTEGHVILLDGLPRSLPVRPKQAPPATALQHNATLARALTWLAGGPEFTCPRLLPHKHAAPAPLSRSFTEAAVEAWAVSSFTKSLAKGTRQEGAQKKAVPNICAVSHMTSSLAFAVAGRADGSQSVGRQAASSSVAVAVPGHLSKALPPAHNFSVDLSGSSLVPWSCSEYPLSGSPDLLPAALQHVWTAQLQQALKDDVKEAAPQYAQAIFGSSVPTVIQQHMASDTISVLHATWDQISSKWNVEDWTGKELFPVESLVTALTARVGFQFIVNELTIRCHTAIGHCGAMSSRSPQAPSYRLTVRVDGQEERLLLSSAQFGPLMNSQGVGTSRIWAKEGFDGCRDFTVQRQDDETVIAVVSRGDCSFADKARRAAAAGASAIIIVDNGQQVTTSFDVDDMTGLILSDFVMAGDGLQDPSIPAAFLASSDQASLLYRNDASACMSSAFEGYRVEQKRCGSDGSGSFNPQSEILGVVNGIFASMQTNADESQPEIEDLFGSVECAC